MHFFRVQSKWWVIAPLFSTTNASIPQVHNQVGIVFGFLQVPIQNKSNRNWAENVSSYLSCSFHICCTGKSRWLRVWETRRKTTSSPAPGLHCTSAIATIVVDCPEYAPRGLYPVSQGEYWLSNVGYWGAKQLGAVQIDMGVYGNSLSVYALQWQGLLVAK